MDPNAQLDLSRRAALTGLAGLTLFAALVRGVGMEALLPQMVEPDADCVRQALVLRAHRLGHLPDLSSLLPDYPLLIGWLLSWLPLEPPAPPTEAPLTEHLRAAAAPFAWGRRLVALISLGLVPATYAAARAVLSRWASLLAAGFAATSLAHVLYSQQARPHAPFAALVAVALASALFLRRTGSLRAHGIAGVAAGLALACLHSGVFLVPAAAIAAWLAPGRRVWKLSLVLTPVGLALWLAYPMLFASSALEGSTLRLTGHRLALESFGGRGFSIVPRLAWSHEPVLTLCVLAALALALARLVTGRPLVGRSKRADLALLAGFGATYSLVLGAFDYAWDKYALPLLPLAALFGAAAVERLLARLSVGNRLRAALCVGLLALPAYASVHWALLRARPDSSARAAAWIEEHLDRERDTVLLGHKLSLPLARRPPASDPVPDWALSPWDLYQRRHPELAQREDAWRLHHLFVLREGASGGRAVLERDALARAIADAGAGWMAIERRGTWNADDRTPEALLAAGARRVVAFEPFDPELVRHESRGYVLGNQAFLRALTARYGGPRVEVWRLDGAR